MPEKLLDYCSKSTLEKMSRTWPGFLAECIDRWKYDATTQHVRFNPHELNTASTDSPLPPPSSSYIAKAFTSSDTIRMGEKDGMPPVVVDPHRLLTAVRDYLEALAFAEIDNNRGGTLTESRRKSVEYKAGT